MCVHIWQCLTLFLCPAWINSWELRIFIQQLRGLSQKLRSEKSARNLVSGAHDFSSIFRSGYMAIGEWFAFRRSLIARCRLILRTSQTDQPRKIQLVWFAQPPRGSAFVEGYLVEIRNTARSKKHAFRISQIWRSFPLPTPPRRGAEI